MKTKILIIYHAAPIKALEFASNDKFTLSASLHWTVKARYLLRCRHLHLLVSPTPCQILPSAENALSSIVVADDFSEPHHALLWNAANGKLIEVPLAHSGPITSLHFYNSATNNSLLSSALWDQTTHAWDCAKSSDINNGNFNMSKDVIASPVSPD